MIDQGEPPNEHKKVNCVYEEFGDEEINYVRGPL